ncbi:hypothetical protein [Pectobacterium phage CX5]|uniref:Uncharacterized protein n=1 Tax=Pectobacterium phage CX5 TaxID=2652426 RepID=A0A5P8D3S2_9CAUD|nr:hypothetical protein [Pectobacterium phage CX5]QFP93659.1 hypothetical protein [Pectobacterium phage CX5-1]
MSVPTATEVAELYWKCLEHQRNVGVTWEVFKYIPEELQRIAPLERRIVYRYHERGVRLMFAHREYSTERANAMLQAIEFDIVAELRTGYDTAKQNFIDAVLKYQRYILTINYYR